MHKTSPITRIVYTPKYKIEQMSLTPYGHWAPIKRWNLKSGKREL